MRTAPENPLPNGFGVCLFLKTTGNAKNDKDPITCLFPFGSVMPLKLKDFREKSPVAPSNEPSGDPQH